MIAVNVYIDDGYTMDGYVAEMPRTHGPISFKFRPMRVTERSRYFHEQKKYSTPEEEEAFGAKTLVRYILSWDVMHNKKQLELTAKNLLNIHPAAYYGILHQVLGVKSPDLMPDASNIDDLENVSDILEETNTKN